jgi:hypothetical protein
VEAARPGRVRAEQGRAARKSIAAQRAALKHWLTQAAAQIGRGLDARA